MTFSLTAKNCQFILEIWPFNHLSMFLGTQHMNSIVVLYSSWTPGLQWILSNHWETKTAIKFAAISWPPLAPADRPSRNPWEMSQLGMSGYHFFLISGYLDTLDTDFFGYLDNWILGYHAYLDTRILGYMDIHFLWIHGYLDTLDINFFHYPDFGYPIQVSGYFWILF